MARVARTVRLAAVLLIPAAGVTLHGQYALDDNLQVGGGRVNPAGGYSMPLQRDVYRINRRTGTFQYDPATAFWAPNRYSVRDQEALMRSGVMESYARPVLTRGPDSGLYTVDQRTGNFRYNEANALAPRTYGVYQSAAPPPLPERTIEIGDSTPRYRAARGSARYDRDRATIPATIPVRDEPATDPARPSRRTPSAGSYANLTPQVYRPPFVRLPSDAE